MICNPDKQPQSPHEDPFLLKYQFSALSRNHCFTSPISRFECTVQNRQYRDILFGQAIQNTRHHLMDKGEFQSDTLNAMLPEELIPQYASGSTVIDFISTVSGECLTRIAMYLVSNALINPTKKNARHLLNWLQMEWNGRLPKLLNTQILPTSAAAVENLFRYSVLAENAEILQMLPKSKLLLNSPHSWFRSYNDKILKPLDYSCICQNREIMHILIDSGALATGIPLGKFLTEIEQLALRRRAQNQILGRIQVDLDIARYLLRNGSNQCSCPINKADISYPQDSSLRWAITSGNEQLVALLLEEEFSINRCYQCLGHAAAAIISKSCDKDAIFKSNLLCRYTQSR
jgi:hypothetical protein